MSSPEIFIRLATEIDAKAILEFELDHFVKTEPTCVALGISREGAREFFANELKNCLKHSASLIAVTEDGDIAGIIICTVRDLADKRPKHKKCLEENATPDAKVVISKKARPIDVLIQYVGSLESKLENTVPSCKDKVLHIETLCVDVIRYGRRGIGKELLKKCLENGRRLGCEGTSASAISQASQNLFRKSGFKVMRLKKHDAIVDECGKRIIHCGDRTNEGQLVFRTL